MIREILGRLLGVVILVAGLAMLGWGLYAAFSLGHWSRIIASVFGVFVALHGLGRAFPGQPPPLPIETDEPLMTAAMEQAQRELHRFKAGLAEGRRQALVKYAMKTGFGENEHVWAMAHAFDGGDVVTSLMSEPVGGDGDATSERSKTAEADIEDWLLVDDSGRMEGGFTQIAMAKIYKRDKGYVPYSIRKGLPNFADLDDPELLS